MRHVRPLIRVVLSSAETEDHRLLQENTAIADKSRTMHLCNMQWRG